MPKKETEEAQKAWELTLRTVSGLLKIFERELQEEVGLPLTWYDVLFNLYVAPDMRLRMQSLADSILLSRSGVTRLLDRIEAAGLVRREPSAEDRRGYYAILTDEGSRMVERARPVHRRGIEKHFATHLNAADIHTLRATISKILMGDPELAGARAVRPVVEPSTVDNR